MRVKQILFPTDLSPASEAARRVAVDVARATRATLHVVHVVPSGADPSPAGQQLTQLALGMGGGFDVTTTVLSGSAGRAIVKYAREENVDLVVVGTHGRTGMSHAILGSVAESVVRLAPCLVLCVPPFLFDKTGTPAAVVPGLDNTELRG